MPYSITTKDGITIQNIPDNIDPSDESLKQRVANQRAIRDGGQQQPQTVQQLDQQTPEDRSFIDKAIGGVEGAATMISGMAATPIAGIAGLADAALSGLGLAPEGAGAARVRQVQDALTFKPRTVEGQGAISGAAEAIKPATDKLEGLKKTMGDDAFDAFGAEMGALMFTMPDAAIEILTAGLGGRTSQMARQAKRLSKIDDATQPQVFREGGTPKAFKEEGILPTRGDVSQNFKQQKTEAQLFESADAVGDQMRQARLGQSQQIKGRLEGLVNKLGVSEELGDSVKTALRTRKNMLKSDRRALYDQLSKESANVNLPLSTSAIKKGLPDAGDIRDITGLVPVQSKVLNNLLEEFSVIGSGGIDQLSIGNFEKFRKRLNNIEKSDQTGQISGATRPLKKALDDEVMMVTESLMKNGDANIAQMAKDARKSHISLMTEFDPKAMTSKLIDSKRKSNVAQVENSQIYQKLSSKSTPIETYSNVIKSLKKSGPNGRKALADIKNRTVLDLVDSAFSAGSRKIKGERTFGGAAYQKAVNNMRPKLEAIFTPKEMKRINNIYDVSERIRPPSGAVPKGSAGFFIDVMQKAGIATLLSKVPGGALAVDQLTELSKLAKNRKALDKALTLPKYKNTVKLVRSQYPNLAVVLGIGKIESTNEDEK